MSSWEFERKKIWGLLLDLKRKVKILEKELLVIKEKSEQPAKLAEQSEGP
ncbi:MAG: hypothetical protein SCK28_12685 [Bacillota bacterium]|nr:hypothetical protein [Bacillota bacterium]